MNVALFSSPTWFYIDSLGYEQGPFSPDEIWRWYLAGYFPADLMVRRTMHSKFTRIASLALGNAIQPIVNFEPHEMQQIVTRRENVGNGNPFEKIKEEGTIGTSVDDGGGIREEEVGSFLKPKWEFKEERSDKIIKKEYIETGMNDEYLKLIVQDEYIKSEKQEVKDEYNKTKVKDVYIEPEVKKEYIKSEVKDEYIKSEVKDEYIKSEGKDEYIKSEGKDEYVEPEAKNEYIKAEFKSEYIEPEFKETSVEIAVNKQIVILEDYDMFKYSKLRKRHYGILKKGEVFTITGVSNSGKSWCLNNGKIQIKVPVNARGSLFDIFIPTGNKDTKPSIAGKETLFQCPRCTRHHSGGQNCKSINKRCRKCNNFGHFAQVHEITDPKFRQVITNTLGINLWPDWDPQPNKMDSEALTPSQGKRSIVEYGYEPESKRGRADPVQAAIGEFRVQGGFQTTRTGEVMEAFWDMDEASCVGPFGTIIY